MILRGTLCTPLEAIPDGGLVIADGRITDVGPADRVLAGAPAGTIRDFSGCTLVPGLIDLHVNGAGGRDFLEGTTDAVTQAARAHAGRGTTALAPTLVTASHRQILTALQAVRKVAEAPPGMTPDLPEIVGIHLEGPFISRVRRGAHPHEPIRPASLEEVVQYREASGGRLRMITLAPEVAGALPLIREAKTWGMVISLGHTDATYEQALEAIEAGATYAIHVFNAMRGFHHREPGAAGAVLDRKEVTAELIADAIHIHPAGLRMVYRLKGPEGVVLASDAVSVAAAPRKVSDSGSCRLGGERLVLREGRAVTLDGTLAGGAITLAEAVRNMVLVAGIPLADAVRMATLNPARVLGIEGRKGRLAVGCDADVLVLNGGLEVEAVFVRGHQVV